MKKLLLMFLLLPIFINAQFCDVQGNVAIYGNYDGGILNINVDVDIPNLKIGVRTYEGVEINLSGPYVDNITEVYYVGYNASNAHCGGSSINTHVNGAPASATITIDGYVSLGNHSGCGNNTTTVNYILNNLNGNDTLMFHKNQYACWGGVTQNISDGGTCCDDGSTPVTPLTIAASSKSDATCAGSGCDGEAQITALGGAQPLTYSWSQGGSTTNTASNLCPGTYTVDVTDAGGNTDSHTFIIDAADSIGVTSSVSDVQCYGDADGSATLTFSGGTMPYNTDWGGEHPNQLPVGTHTFTVTDANGCQVTDSVVINQPDSLTATLDVTNATTDCDGLISITPSGGTSPYDIVWDSDGSNLTVLGDLCAGEYCAEITDGNGCVKTFCATVEGSSVGLKDYTNTQSINLSPNPSKGIATLKIESQNVDLAEVSVYNALGKQVLTEKHGITKGMNTHTLDVQHSGVYIVVVATKNNRKTLRWIVE